MRGELDEEEGGAALETSCADREEEVRRPGGAGGLDVDLFPDSEPLQRGVEALENGIRDSLRRPQLLRRRKREDELLSKRASIGIRL